MRARLLQAGLLLFCWAGVASGMSQLSASDHGLFGVMIYIVGIAIVAWVFIYTVRCFLRPGERDSRHVKRRILRDDW